MESEPEFHLPADGPDSASGAAERLDAVCGDGEQAEDFCDHGAGILAGLVGQKVSYPNTPEFFPEPGVRCAQGRFLKASARVDSVRSSGRMTGESGRPAG